MGSPKKRPIPPCFLALCLVAMAGCTDNPSPGATQPSPSATRTAASPGEPTPSETEAGDGEASGLSTAQAHRSDPAGRVTSSGDRPPSYLEIDAATIRGRGTEVEFAVDLAARVPTRVPDARTAIQVSFMLTMDDGSRAQVTARAAANGWSATTTNGDEVTPAAVAIHGRTVKLTVGWDSLGGPRPFRWIASATWSKQASGRSSYAFDYTPKKGFARYPM
jgi:hypothetical protein